MAGRKSKIVHLSAVQHHALGRIKSAPMRVVCGIDEVGRGPFAGPVTVAGVLFAKDFFHEDIRDSKEMTHKERVRVLHDIIYPNALETIVLSQSAEYIDQVGIGVVQEELTEAVALYMRHRFPTCLVVQDGNHPTKIDGSTKNVIWLPSADALVPSVSAASILAKVTRDTYMLSMAEQYPGYGFETNMGYRSEAHLRGLAQYGVCPLHRRSWRPVKPFC